MKIYPIIDPLIDPIISIFDRNVQRINVVVFQTCLKYNKNRFEICISLKFVLHI